MLLRVTTLIISIATFCSADSLTLRSGRVVHGQYLGGDTRQIRMAVGDLVDTEKETARLLAKFLLTPSGHPPKITQMTPWVA